MNETVFDKDWSWLRGSTDAGKAYAMMKRLLVGAWRRDELARNEAAD